MAFRNGAIQHAWEVKLTDSQGGSRVTREALGGAVLDVVGSGLVRMLEQGLMSYLTPILEPNIPKYATTDVVNFGNISSFFVSTD